MELYNDSDAPALDHGVKARLHRLDPLLEVTFSKYAIDQITGEPLSVHVTPDWEDEPEFEKVRRCGNVNAVLDPGWHLWVQDPDGQHHLLMSYPAEIGFGHREVAKLEADVARYMRPSDIIAEIHKKQRARKEKAQRDHLTERADIIKANKSRIHDLLFEDKPGIRGGKFTSGPGLNKRGNMEDQVLSDTEDGWEKPEQK